MKTKISSIFILILCAIFLSGFSLKKEESAESVLRKMAVQNGGRVKPFESFAKEALLSVTGKMHVEPTPTMVVLDWMAQPDRWYTKSFLPVRSEDLKKEFSLMVIGGKISPELVLTHDPFQRKVQEALAKEQKKETLHPLEKKRIELYDQARLFQTIAQGSLPGFFPAPGNLNQGWIALSGLADLEKRALLEKTYSPAELAAVQAALARLIQAFRENKTEDLQKAAAGFSALLERMVSARGGPATPFGGDTHGIAIDKSKIDIELLYNQINPFKWAWILYLASALLWFLLRDRVSPTALSLFTGAFFLHSFGFFLRCYLAGRPPVTNMYESVIWVAWAAALFAVILALIYKKTLLLASSAWFAFFALLVGESFPTFLDPSLAPLVPVLRNNYWLTVHVLTITLSYGAFAFAWAVAHALLIKFAFHPHKTQEQEQLGEYLYRALQIGVVLLTTGTILGGVWANDSWGRFWGWDPKETWALIALLGYLVVLHGRFAGWIGAFGTAVGSVLAFLGVLMAWYGVNFVLAAGFHSYGFGGGGFPYVSAVVLMDLVFILFLAIRYNRQKFHPALSHKGR